MVKTGFIKFLIFCSLSICPHCLFSQVISNNEMAKEKHFVYEVKEMDEFFERFNEKWMNFLRDLMTNRAHS